DIGLPVPRDGENHPAVRTVEINSLPERETGLADDNMNTFREAELFAVADVIQFPHFIHPWSCRVNHVLRFRTEMAIVQPIPDMSAGDFALTVIDERFSFAVVQAEG